MTQNLVTLETPKGQIQISMGWDRPLQEVFCSLCLLDADGDEDIEGDDDDELMMPFSFPGGVEQVAACLVERNLAAPRAMLAATALDQAADMGNVIRRFSPGGVLLEERFF